MSWTSSAIATPGYCGASQISDIGSRFSLFSALNNQSSEAQGEWRRKWSYLNVEDDSVRSVGGQREKTGTRSLWKGRLEAEMEKGLVEQGD